MGLPTLLNHCHSAMVSLEVVILVSWYHDNNLVKSHGYHTNSIDYHCLGNLIKIAGWNTNSCLRFLGNTTRFGMTRARIPATTDGPRCAVFHACALGHRELVPASLTWRDVTWGWWRHFRVFLLWRTKLWKQNNAKTKIFHRNSGHKLGQTKPATKWQRHNDEEHYVVSIVCNLV